MPKLFAGLERDGHTFRPFVFPDDGHGSARVMCLCSQAVISVDLDKLPTQTDNSPAV